MREHTTAAENVASNYQYWRDHGGEWGNEYDTRKRRMVLYHIQEIMLTQYIAAHAPAKVLEFGCGVGRHLRNLSQLRGIDAHGFDQSAAMAGQIARWASPEWIAEHVTVGLPTGGLPYPDKSFDLVYSAEVLVHVRPEDLEGILLELLRVSKGHVLHFEPSVNFGVAGDVHDGCWKHDLVAAYARLGHTCELLPSGYTAHSPYRVLFGDEPARFTWSPMVLSMYRAMEEQLDAGFADAEVARVQAAQRASLFEARAGELEGALAQQRTDAEKAIAHERAETETARAHAAALQARTTDLTDQLAAVFEEKQAALRSLWDAEAKAAGLTKALGRAIRVGDDHAATLLKQIKAERDRADAALATQDLFIKRVRPLTGR